MITRAMISGGGTGGHIFPALAIGEAIRAANPEADVRFVGAKGGMEERLIPAAGYPLDTLHIRGLQRSLTLRNIRRNLGLPFLLAGAYYKAYQLLKKYKPEVVVGVGGYASFALVRVAAYLGIPTAIQEQNAFPGLSNKSLAKVVDRVCLGNQEAEKFFPEGKCTFTGNPLRGNLKRMDKAEACVRFGLDPKRPVLLVVGGSLGSKSINEAIADSLNAIQRAGLQVLWQCGRGNYAKYQNLPLAGTGVQLLPFIEDMAAAYSAADLVACRSGALTIAELVQLRKPSILIPSPNVAEDHQTHNARSLSIHNAAQLLPDSQAYVGLIPLALELIAAPIRLTEMEVALAALPQPNATEAILQVLTEIVASKRAK
jgi:UDP-N-acetylglucosamine--N-acetylmuramyl-(pentapeptide) pyrophosphoryl-undecaprenol N-acetylglucosamine transferase